MAEEILAEEEEFPDWHPGDMEELLREMDALEESIADTLFENNPPTSSYSAGVDQAIENANKSFRKTKETMDRIESLQNQLKEK